MRLFLGVAVPAELANQLAGMARRVTLPEPRWSTPEQMHVTLVFLGDVAEERVDAIREGVGKLAVQTMELAVTELGGFSHSGVLYAKVQATPALVKLQAEACGEMRRCGVELEDEPFRPHITLARSPVRFHFPGCRLVQPLRFVTDAMHLYRSRPVPGGSCYEVLCSARAPRSE